MAVKYNNPFEVNDFSGGITDDLYEQKYNTAETIDNFNIASDGKLITREGSVLDDETNPQIPAGVQRVGALINYANSDKMFVHSSDKIYYRNPSAYTTLTGPSGNDVFSSGDTTNVLSYSQWNDHIFLTTDDFPRPQKIYKDSGGTYRVRTSGLPELASAPTVTAGAAGANSYVYAFHYEYTYTVNDQTFQDVGRTELVSLTSAAAPDSNTVNITNIPVISNGVIDNWDTTVIKVFIYRTIAGGDVFYKIGEVTNGTTIYNDSAADASITSGLLLYTNDGTVDFDPTPESKVLHVVNNIGYYGFIQDGSDKYPFRIRQSVPGDPDSCPESFFIEVEDEIVGIHSVNSIPIVLCKRHIYRLEGNYDQFGRGGINFVRLSDTAGCVSSQSLVQADPGNGAGALFWAGNDGFYSTNGYQVIKISDNINTRYKTILDAQSQQNRIYGKFDETERRILWGIQSASASLDNDTIIALDLRWGVSARSTFYTWSGTSFRPTALEYFNGKLYRGDSRGYVFEHEMTNKTDPKVDTVVTPSDWDTETIIWTYKSINNNFGGTFFRKMPTKIQLTAGNEGNVTIQISAIGDVGRTVRNCNIIRIRTNFVWGSDEFVWGNPDCVWNAEGVIEQWRRFPARGLRLSYLNTVITNGYAPIYNSDVYGTATFDNTANTVTIDSDTWPTDVVDYFIATEIDGYVKEYQVDARTSNTVLSVIDSANDLPTGSYKWVIKGYKREEVLNLVSYNIHWVDISQTQQTFEVGQSGSNA